VLPPSQDPHDFLSFAPYHWPNCNWCSHGTTHLIMIAWTTCPYIARDGRVNPDVRLLNAPAAINFAAQSILYNAVAYALQKTSAYSSAAVAFIDAFFLEPATKMNPNMNFGQVVRGPPPKGSQGTFTGVLDLRGIVKIINGVAILKAAESPDWTPARDEEMATWMSAYAGWLQNSTLGKMSASRPNNHGTFYVSQLTSTRVLAGNVQGAADALQGYFSHQYLDQLAASGEQPFEAVRTRPFHYRCFNLEAMIVNAKIGDQLGLNLWAVKSRYGATIQTALDYTMKLNPKFEDVTEILPHVASVAAAYGDPTGKYAAFLKKTMGDYQNKAFWLYDQTSALSSSPAAQSAKANAVATPGVGVPDSVPFQCPAIFGTLDRIQIDDDVYVTCEELKPFYEIAVPQDA
ncbi:chondroitin AC/alginate lyase, partial [Athelia psychrophila]